MKKVSYPLLTLLILITTIVRGQQELTVRKIMQDPKTWIGTSPSSVFWSEDSESIYFNWNPEANPGDSIYYISTSDHQPKKLSTDKRLQLPSRFGDYNQSRTLKTYIKNGDVFILELASGKQTQITNTVDRINSVSFSFDEKHLHYQAGSNLFSWEIASGKMTQLTNFKSGKKKSEKSKSEQNQWITDDELHMMVVISERNENGDARNKINKQNQPQRPKEIYLGDKRASNISLSGSRNFIVYTLSSRPKGTTRTIVPNYVTESGYTEDITARTNVGSALSSREVWIYNIKEDTVYQVATKTLPGIKDVPDYYVDYDKFKDSDSEEAKPRKVYTSGPRWSEDGSQAIVSFTSKDNKDRWVALLDLNNGSVKVIDRQRDEAWIAGPGIGWFSREEIGWLPDNKVWFQSEESGYSHLYVYDIRSGKKKALTKGNYEVYSPVVSRDKTKWYFTANIAHPGVRHFYSMPIKGGKIEKITSLEGNNDVVMSPDESMLAVLYSSANKPWELYLVDNKPGAEPKKITQSLTEEFQSYSWREPEYITFKARDEAMVHARLYKPESPQPGGPAVIFVHGAGYLQNAHKWWSSYFHEYMFHNLLVDNGYTVLDIDYRASSGYGRDWRTGIYRHMGGKDLTDQVDGAKYLVENQNIGADKIGIYGGSYGGFITLMALFTEPDVFAAGAALRSVTDWAHYNHSYTSPILNTPVEDSLSYVRSSPIYYAEGLTKPLLICHGVVDTNVHFQDVVRLSQRLIELEKENWEMALYPVESHGFREPSSWVDEYSRIFKLFEEHLK
jgi:dipeptidyl aminopeptidase/acylaminoacyl peptidase